jgi:hypothetical protein
MEFDAYVLPATPLALAIDAEYLADEHLDMLPLAIQENWLGLPDQAWSDLLDALGREFGLGWHAESGVSLRAFFVDWLDSHEVDAEPEYTEMVCLVDALQGREFQGETEADRAAYERGRRGRQIGSMRELTAAGAAHATLTAPPIVGSRAAPRARGAGRPRAVSRASSRSGRPPASPSSRPLGPRQSRPTPVPAEDRLMGYRARERKRRRRVAQGHAQTEARQSGSSARRRLLTIVRQKTCCAACGWILKPGADMVYRHEPREALCVRCADRDRLKYRPSLHWEKAHSTRAAA